jgi:ankyrin repeat protein
VLNSELALEYKMEILTAKDQDGTPGLFMALQNGHTDTVKTFVEQVLNSELALEYKMEILAVKNQDGTPGLLFALKNGHTDTVKTFVEAVIALDKVGIDFKDDWDNLKNNENIQKSVIALDKAGVDLKVNWHRFMEKNDKGETLLDLAASYVINGVFFNRYVFFDKYKKTGGIWNRAD